MSVQKKVAKKVGRKVGKWAMRRLVKFVDTQTGRVTRSDIEIQAIRDLLIPEAIEDLSDAIMVYSIQRFGTESFADATELVAKFREAEEDNNG